MRVNRSPMAVSIAVLAVLSEIGSGQSLTVTGTVRDSVTNSGVDSAAVTFINAAEPLDRHTVISNQFGNWSVSLEPTSVQYPPAVPRSFALGQNYPNPFNPSTHIPFSVSRAGVVRLSVVNILGQVLDKREQVLGPGWFDVEWHAKGGAGVLLYTIETAAGSATGKMIQLDGGDRGGLGEIHSTGGRTTATESYSRSSTLYTVITEGFAYEPDTTAVSVSGGEKVDIQLTSIHHRAFAFDLHNDVLEKVVTGYQLGPHNAINQSDLPRFARGGVDAQMLSVWVDPSTFSAQPFARANQMIDSFLVQIDRNPLAMTQARTTAEIRAAGAAGKFAGVLGLEGGHAIENSIDNLIALYDRGIRYMTITWNNSTSWATAAADPQSATKGLSPFGEQVIRTMDSLGIIIDVSHTGIRTISDILAITTHPIIASHSGVRALNNHYRNLTDDQITAIAGTGGVIGVVFYPPFLSASGTATIETVLDHCDYIRNLVGVDHLAIGSDFDGIEVTPAGLEDVSRLPALTLGLLRRGYSREDVRKILGENYMRVFESICH